MSDPGFSMSLDLTSLVSEVNSAKLAYSYSLEHLYSTITGISSVNLSGSSVLPCFDTWYFPFGGQVTLCLSQFSDSFSYVGQGVLLIASVSALSIVFRS
ncbi:MAG: hypothetical protein HQL75_07240 [Magnetococcales bacterium]|nr:hypothetical protein [Magnetococcales bacterium]